MLEPHHIFAASYGVPSTNWFGDWISVADRVPELDQIVWLHDMAQRIGPWIGARADSGEGWLWCRSYGSEWYDWSKSRWDADLEDSDDQPTHWLPLPNPPAHLGSPNTKPRNLGPTAPASGDKAS